MCFYLKQCVLIQISFDFLRLAASLRGAHVIGMRKAQLLCVSSHDPQGDVTMIPSIPAGLNKLSIYGGYTIITARPWGFVSIISAKSCSMTVKIVFSSDDHIGSCGIGPCQWQISALLDLAVQLWVLPNVTLGMPKTSKNRLKRSSRHLETDDFS